MDLHQNVFYGYRGPGMNEQARERQLENNLTKALVNTLSHGGKQVWQPFLAQLGIDAADDANFILQRESLPSGRPAHKKRRVLLGISKRKSTWPIKANGNVDPKGRPDAWLYGDGFAVLVECKVNESDFSPRQMAGHLARLGITKPTSQNVILKTWREMHGFFRKLLPSLTATSRFLVEQLIQFLEYTDMSAFTGFQREHFDYFLLHDDEDQRRWVKAQVDDFASRVRAKLKKCCWFYQIHRVGNLGISASYCWAKFGPASILEPFKPTHQSISISPHGMSMFVNTEGKPAAKGLKHVLKHSADEFRSALKKLHHFEPFVLELDQQFLVRPRELEHNPTMRLHSSVLFPDGKPGLTAESADEVWAAFRTTVLQLPLLYFAIKRIEKADQLMRLSTNAAVERVVEVFRHNHPVVKLLNGGKTPSWSA